MSSPNTPSHVDAKSSDAGLPKKEAEKGVGLPLTIATLIAAGVAVKATDAEAGQCEMPAAVQGQEQCARTVTLRHATDNTACVTVSPRQDGMLDIRAQLSMGRETESVHFVLDPGGDNRQNQVGHHMRRGGRLIAHLNLFAEGGNVVIILDGYNAQGQREHRTRETMPIPQVCAPPQPPDQPSGRRHDEEGTSGGTNGGGDAGTGTSTADRGGDGRRERQPDPREIFAFLPPEFSVHGQFEETSDRGEPDQTRVDEHNPAPLLSARAALRRGQLRTVQFDPDQVPAPDGVDLENALIAPDGNGGIRIFVGKSIGEQGTPYEAVYEGHMTEPNRPQTVRFVRIAPALGSDIGSGGPQSLELNGGIVLSVRNGEFSARPFASSVNGPSCDAIALPDEAVTGKAPIGVFCEQDSMYGTRRYAGSILIDGTDLSDPAAIAAFRRVTRMRIANRQPGIDHEAEDIAIVASRIAPLSRMPSVPFEEEFPPDVYVDAAVSHFMRPSYNPANIIVPLPSGTQSSGSGSTVPQSGTPPPPLPSAPPDIGPPASGSGSPPSSSLRMTPPPHPRFRDLRRSHRDGRRV